MPSKRKKKIPKRAVKRVERIAEKPENKENTKVERVMSQKITLTNPEFPEASLTFEKAPAGRGRPRRQSQARLEFMQRLKNQQSSFFVPSVYSTSGSTSMAPLSSSSSIVPQSMISSSSGPMYNTSAGYALAGMKSTDPYNQQITFPSSHGKPIKPHVGSMSNQIQYGQMSPTAMTLFELGWRPQGTTTRHSRSPEPYRTTSQKKGGEKRKRKARKTRKH